MPYRAEFRSAADQAFDRLVDLGALDVEHPRQGSITALMPDNVGPEQLAGAFGLDITEITISPAEGRDDGSVWVLSPRPIQVGRLRIVPADAEAEPGALRLIDAAAFGTGLHPTTALCLEAIEDAVRIAPPPAVLDVGTGSGILALGALMMGVPLALGIDIDDESLRVASENARLNALEQRLQLTRGGPEAVTGTWPLVLANVLPAPLIEMAPALVRRVGHHSRLVLSGIPTSAEGEVNQAYRRLGMHRVSVASRAGWVAIVLQASW